MITPLQAELKQCLSTSNSNKRFITTQPDNIEFSERSVKQIDEIQIELSNFMLGQEEYSGISDKNLVDRICRLCDTQPDERFNIKNSVECAKALTDIISNYMDKDITTKAESATSKQSVEDVQSNYKIPESHGETSIQSIDRSTVKKTNTLELKQETQEPSTIKLLSKQEIDGMEKEVLDTFNLTFCTGYESLHDFFKSGSLSNSLARLKLTTDFLPLLSAALEIFRFSEEFKGKNTKELLEHLGFIYDGMEDEELDELTTKLNETYKIIETQEDLEQVIKEFNFYIKDIKYKERKMTGFEDPEIPFSSVGEYSVHTKDPEIRKKVYQNLSALKEKALKAYKYDINKMRATIDYALYKANVELVHSKTRELALGFNLNPLLVKESVLIESKVNETYRLDEQLKNKSISSEEYEQKISQTKFGNCDHFSDNVFRTFRDLDYDKGIFGQAMITSSMPDQIGHCFNYVTVNDIIMIVDPWKGISFDLGSLKDYYSEFCYTDNPYEIQFCSNGDTEHEVINSLTYSFPLVIALDIIKDEYVPPPDNNIHNKPSPEES